MGAQQSCALAILRGRVGDSAAGNAVQRQVPRLQQSPVPRQIRAQEVAKCCRPQRSAPRHGCGGLHQKAQA